MSEPRFRRSSYCANGGCVCVADHEGRVLMRGTDPGGPVLAFDRDAWGRFLAAVKAGEMDGPL